MVKVLRPLRSVNRIESACLSRVVASDAGLCKLSHRTEAEFGELTLNTNVYVVLRLLGLSSVFVGFGEGVCKAKDVLVI